MYDVADSDLNVASENRIVTIQDTTAPVVILNGGSPVDIEVGSFYLDAGASFMDNYDGTGTILGSGSVDTNTLGTYTLSYGYTDTQGNMALTIDRTVNVVDTTLPVINLVGLSTINQEVGGTYTDS